MITVSHLTKTYGGFRAVDDVTFTAQPGRVTGFLGPNGAGKSTTIKMLTGILVPSGGHVRVDGLEPSRQRVELASRIGVVFDEWVEPCLVRRAEPAGEIYPRVPPPVAGSFSALLARREE